MAVIKQTVDSREREGGAVTVGGNADRCSRCEVSLVIPQQTTHRTITSPRSTTPGCTHWGNRSQHASAIPSHLTSHGTVRHSQNASAWCPSANEWTKKTHTAKCRWAVKWNENTHSQVSLSCKVQSLCLPDRGWKRRSSALNEISQTQNDSVLTLLLCATLRGSGGEAWKQRRWRVPTIPVGGRLRPEKQKP